MIIAHHGLIFNSPDRLAGRRPGILARAAGRRQRSDRNHAGTNRAKPIFVHTTYTTLGGCSGCCGHRHTTVPEADRCAEDYRIAQWDRGEFPDRFVFAVAAAAVWPLDAARASAWARAWTGFDSRRRLERLAPAGVRELTDAELGVLYRARCARGYYKR